VPEVGLPRAFRLRKPAQFQAVGRARAGRRQTRGWLALNATPIDGETAPRVGITVAKRLARRAVDRASVKRVLREAARAALPDLRGSPGWPLHIVVRLNAPLPDPTTMPRPQWKRQLRSDADALFKQLARDVARRGSRA
jgi:ribonuclease P protein component